MTHNVLARRDESLERRINIVEIYIGDKAIDAGVDTGRLFPVHIALHRNEIGQHLQVSKPTRKHSVGVVTADALKIIALEIELARLQQVGFTQARLLTEQRGTECWPVALVLPA